MTPKKKSPLTKLSLVLPVSVFIIGLFLTMVSEPSAGDSWGMSVLVWVIGGFLLAGFLSILLSVVALCKKEPKSFCSLIISLPYTLLILSMVFNHLESEAYAYDYKKRGNESQELTHQIQNGTVNVLDVDWENAAVAEMGALSNLSKNHSTVLTSEVIETLLEEHPKLSSYVMTHPNVPKDQLEEMFEEAYRSCEQGIRYFELSLICTNPSLSKDLVERVARSETLAYGAVGPARQELERRAKENGEEPPKWKE